MIAIVTDDYEKAWRYLDAGVPDPVFKIVQSPADAEGVQPDAVVYISGDTRVFELLVGRLETRLQKAERVSSG